MEGKVEEGKEPFDVNDIIFFIGDNEYKEVVESIQRYLKWVYFRNKDIEWHSDQTIILDSRLPIEELKGKIEAGEKKILIIIDFQDSSSNFNGVQLVKRLRYLFPWGIRKEINSEEKKTGDNEKDYVFEFWPIIFLSIDEVWKFEVALKRANLIFEKISEDKETILGKHFLPSLKNTYYLKIPEEINKLGGIIHIARKVNLELRIARQETEAAFLAYDEHGGRH